MKYIKPETTNVTTRPTKTGNGAVSLRTLFPGDYVLKMGGPVLSAAGQNRDHVLTIGPGVYLGKSGETDDFVNHSCNPNTVLQIDNDNAILIATKPIVVGEEITFDYGATLEPDDTWTMQCGCGAFNCRGVISSKT